MIPDQLGRFRTILDKSPSVFSDSLPIEFQFVADLAENADRYSHTGFLQEHDREQPDSVLEEIADAVDRYVVNQRVPRKYIGELSVERNEIERQVRRIGEKVGEIAGKASKILLAWVSEALFALKDAQGGSQPSRDSDHLLGEVAEFWERFIRGYPISDTMIEKYLPTLFQSNVDSDFVSGEVAGLLYFASRRDHNIVECLPLDDRRIALEFMLYHTINDLSIAAIYGRSALTQARQDGRTKGAHLKNDMLRAYYEIREKEPSIKLSEAKSRVLSRFNNPISFRQFERYIEKNKRPL